MGQLDFDKFYIITIQIAKQGGGTLTIKNKFDKSFTDGGRAGVVKCLLNFSGWPWENRDEYFLPKNTAIFCVWFPVIWPYQFAYSRKIKYLRSYNTTHGHFSENSRK